MYTGQKEKYIAVVFNFSHSPNTTTPASISIAANVTRYLATIGGTAAAPATDIFKVVMVRAGVLKNLYYKALPTSALTNATHKFTVLKNGAVPSAPEGLSAFWNPATKSGNDLTGYITVLPGDEISVRVQTFAGTGTIIRPSVSFELEVEDDYPNPWDYDPASKIISYTAGNVVVTGEVRSNAGFRFPDGSVQTVAAVGGTPGPQGIPGPQGPQGVPGPAGGGGGGGTPGISESGGKIGIGLDPTRNPQEKLTLAPDSNLATEMPTPSGVVAAASPVSGGLPTDDYYFRVTASDGKGWTKASAQLLFNLADPDHGIRISWNPVLGATKYRVYRALTAAGAYKYIEVTDTYYDYINDAAFTLTGSPPEEATAFINKLSVAGDSWLLGGKVGIGTATPMASLEVAGYARIQGLEFRKAEGVAWGSAHIRVLHSGFYASENYPQLAISGALGTSGEAKIRLFGNTSVGGILQVDGDSTFWGKVEVHGNTFLRGAVGIGTLATSGHQLHVEGSVYCTGNFVGSSKRWKTNIRTIKGALSKVKRLRGISYNQKDDDKRAIGLVAEEVGEVIPEIVTYEENGKDAQGLDYSRLVAVLVEAVKEQQGQIEELKDTVKSLLVNKSKAAGLA